MQGGSEMNPQIAFEFISGIAFMVLIGLTLINCSGADEEEEYKDEHEDQAI